MEPNLHPGAGQSLHPDQLDSLEILADPYSLYRALRPASPLTFKVSYPQPPSGPPAPPCSWAVMKHADVLAVLRDPETFSSDVFKVVDVPPRLMLLHDDPPLHTQLRRLVSKAFTPRLVATLESKIAQRARQLLQAFRPEGVEFMGAYAIPLALHTVLTLLGVSAEEEAEVSHWTRALLYSEAMSDEERQSRIGQLLDYTNKAVLARRQQRSSDLLSALVEAESEGQALKHEEVVSFAGVLLAVGNETAANLTGNMLGLLAERRELWQQARADRSLVEPIVEEVLRYESPIQRMLRVATRDVELSGRKIRQGELVDVLFGAANRDPEAFEDAETFQVRRRTAPHFAFGRGTHFCLGAPLARLQAKVTLNEMLDRFPAIARGSEPAVRQGVTLSSFGYERLPLSLEPAPESQG